VAAAALDTKGAAAWAAMPSKQGLDADWRPHE